MIDKRLNIAFCKYTAAGRDSVGLFGCLRGGVHFIGTHFQEGRHLVNKCAGAAGTGAVHTDLQTMCQEKNLSVFAA